MPFSTDELTIARDTVEYVTGQSVARYADATERTAAIPAPTLNQLSLLDDRPGVVQYWDGSAWADAAGEPGPPGISQGQYEYKWKSVTTATDPVHGYVKGNTLDPETFTFLYISAYNSTEQAVIDLSRLKAGDQLFIYEFGQFDSWNQYDLTDVPINHANEWFELPVVYADTGTLPFAPPNNTRINVMLPVGGGVTSVDGQTGVVDLSAKYVDITGDTMTGALKLGERPIVPTRSVEAGTTEVVTPMDASDGILDRIVLDPSGRVGILTDGVADPATLLTVGSDQGAMWDSNAATGVSAQPVNWDVGTVCGFMSMPVARTTVSSGLIGLSTAGWYDSPTGHMTSYVGVMVNGSSVRNGGTATITDSIGIDIADQAQNEGVVNGYGIRQHGPGDINSFAGVIQGLAGFRHGDITTPSWTSGFGPPEGNATAAVGSLYSRRDGSTGTAIYRKETGTGNTGWIATAGGGSGAVSSVDGRTGAVTLSDLYVDVAGDTMTGPLAIGPGNTAASGYLRLPNNQGVSARNAANSADVPLLRLRNDDVVIIGDGTHVTYVGQALGVGAGVYASSGNIRMQNNQTVVWRNAGNTADVPAMKVNLNDVLEIAVGTVGTIATLTGPITNNVAAANTAAVTLTIAGTTHAEMRASTFGLGIGTNTLKVAASGAQENLALGANAGASLTTGGQNAVIGVLAGVTSTAGNALTSASGQTILGYAAGSSTATQNNNITALGKDSKCGGGAATAVGNTASAGGQASVAAGYASKSPGISSVAIGDSSNAAGPQTIVIGKSGNATGGSDDSIAIGNAASIVGVGAVAIGASTSVPANNGIAIGNTAKVGSTVGGISIGFEAGKITTTAAGTLVGYQAGKAVTTGALNTMVGQSAGILATSGNNTLIGGRAGDTVSTGDNNTLIGAVAGGSTLTTGGLNTLVGSFATCSGADASVTAMGYSVGVSGANTVAVGATASAVGAGSVVVGSAAKAGTAGNISIGFEAGKVSTTGIESTLIGYQAGRALTTANENTLIGYQAGLIVTGGSNTMVGDQAGRAATGASNTLIGRYAGNTISTGAGNTLVGTTAGGSFLTTGSNNTIVGKDAYCAAANSSTVVIGSGAQVAAAYNIAIGAGTNASNNGGIAIGVDSAGTAATTAVANEIKLGVTTHTLNIPGKVQTLTMVDPANLVLGTTTGTKIGTAATQKLGFWNATPIVQPAGWSVTAGYTALKAIDPQTCTLTDLARFVGTLVDQVVKAAGLAGS